MSEIQKFNDRPSKYNRDKVIEQLKANFASNNLEVDEFEHRMEIAHKTTDKGELKSLIDDLPALDTANEAPPARTSEATYELNHGQVKVNESIVSIFASVNRKGIWVPPKHLEAVSIFGSTNLDFRKAKLNPGTTKIEVVSIFGSLDIIVPPGINIDTAGVGIFGSFENQAETQVDPHAPTLLIEGTAIFGSVSIRVKS